MSEEEKLTSAQPEPTQPQAPETPAPQPEEAAGKPVAYASPLKRIWAWVGVVYMVIIVFLMTYMFSTGRYLQGLASLMVIPALGGVAASSLWLWHAGQRRDLTHAVVLGLILAACAVLAVLGLISGIPALMANFGG